MKDPRYAKLAKLLVHHSAEIQAGNTVLVEAFEIPPEFTIELVRAIADAGGVPLVQTYQDGVRRALLNALTEQQIKLSADLDVARMSRMDCYMGVRGSHNIAELSDIPREKMDLWEKLYLHPVHLEQRVKKTRWVVLRWPHPSMAQAANMSTEAFEDFYFRVCADVDYAKMREAMRPLEDLMKRTDAVHITGPGTDLRFSIKGIGAKMCYGERNIPDGECFSCPAKESVQGHVQYNCETTYRGTIFNNIRLAFKDGRIVEATADSPPNTKKLNEILDSDAGSRYIGEFSLAFNPHIKKPMKDILFDEKIDGSFHFTPGQAYEDVGNGNQSQIHWDMVCIQRPDFGGGEVRFDGKVIRKDGRFVVRELEGLNPENLGA
ncbi:MAG TPA: aminopeptidase [Tepidisphaeraceae bacterium]|nr:aminopeptidase [Tepidisphaeraceae bacterium]